MQRNLQINKEKKLKYISVLIICKAKNTEMYVFLKNYKSELYACKLQIVKVIFF